MLGGYNCLIGRGFRLLLLLLRLLLLNIFKTAKNCQILSLIYSFFVSVCVGHKTAN